MVGIIIPVFNAEKYLSSCIESILQQSYKNFECILVNDGSSDNSGKICDEYAKKDSRIRVIHKENSGPSSARNLGLKIAIGEYIMFCDSDDCVSKYWCQIMRETISKSPSAFIVCEVKKVSIKDIYVYNENVIDYKIMRCNYYDIYSKGLSGYPVNKIYRRKLLSDNNIFFDEQKHYAEDVDFNIRYCKFCDSVIQINKSLYYYIQNDNSLMHKYYPNLFFMLLDTFWDRLPLITEQDLGKYCDSWLYRFVNLFENVFDKRNNMSYLEKMRYNQKMLNTKEVKYCIEHCTEPQNSLFMKVLNTKNYYLFRAFQKIVKVKAKLKRGK